MCLTLPLIPALNTVSKFAIADSGATSNFFTTDAPVHNIRPACHPIKVKIPNGNQLESTHVFEIAIPGLPPEASIGHIIPGMKGHSLVSLVQLCRAGCIVYMDKNQMSIGHNGKLEMKATKCERTGLWLIPLSSAKERPVQETGEVAANVFQTSTKSEWIQYLHQACFSPVPSTWKKPLTMITSCHGLASHNQGNRQVFAAIHGDNQRPPC
jgi:hypothetical protein